MIFFSKNFILTEKCQYFYPEIFDTRFVNCIEDNNNINSFNEIKVIILIKNNFYIIYQNLLDFLRIINKKV